MCQSLGSVVIVWDGERSKTEDKDLGKRYTDKLWAGTNCHYLILQETHCGRGFESGGLLVNIHMINICGGARAGGQGGRRSWTAVRPHQKLRRWNARWWSSLQLCHESGSQGGDGLDEVPSPECNSWQALQWQASATSILSNGRNECLCPNEESWTAQCTSLRLRRPCNWNDLSSINRNERDVEWNVRNAGDKEAVLNKLR